MKQTLGGPGFDRVAVGAALATVLIAGAALAETWDRGDRGDHYRTGWTVMADGELLCRDPFVRPEHREIECRTSLRGRFAPR